MGLRRALVVGVAVMALAVVVLVVLSSAAASTRAEALTPAHLGEAFAALEVIDDRVEVRPSGLSQWQAAEDGQALVAGDGLRTDETGFAEVLYLDGSRTRLDGSTLYDLVELDGDALAPIIRTRLDVGRTWHRVQHVTGERGAYEVETAVGTAAVRGTTFIVECDLRPVCTFSVLDGVVVVTTPEGLEFTVEADEELTLGRDDGTAEGVTRAGGPAVGGGDGGDGGDDPDGDAGGDGDDGTTGPPDRPALPDQGPRPALGGIDVVEVARETVPSGALAIRPFSAQNLELDRSAGIFGDAQESCAVTINGRNADLAATKETAIVTDVDDVLVVDALSTGPLESYAVTLGLGTLSLPAASGTIDPGEDAARFRGTVDVGQQARWGVGLYEVTATTTGTRCRVVTWIDVQGATPVAPLLTIPGVAALLVGVVSVAGLVAAIGSLSPSSLTSSSFTPKLDL